MSKLHITVLLICLFKINQSFRNLVLIVLIDLLLIVC